MPAALSLVDDTPYLHAETLEPAADPSLDTIESAPVLSIAYHPDPARVGQAARLGRSGADVSRLSPDFGGAPLGDPYVSRQPLRVAPVPGGFELVPTEGQAVVVDGALLTGRRRASLADVRVGVTIELAGRVVLMLHNAPVNAVAGDSYGLVGGSVAMARVRRAIARVAELDVPVLIRGETGVGKERVAQAVHAASRRAGYACVAVNMAAIGPTTAASELFGHVRGAFTGAAVTHDGLFCRADRGTLFLDEIGDAPEGVQAMLLRALETGEVLPVGATEPRSVDVRIVAATDADLDVAGGFRAALLHRLAGFSIAVPALRERRDDIPLLLAHFLRRELDAVGEGRRLACAPTAQPWLPASIVARLCAYDWPGNVRQLANVVRQIVVANRGAARARLDPEIEAMLDAAPSRALPEPPPTLDEDAVEAAMRAHRWALGPAAKALGVARSTLYDLVERHPNLRIAKDVPAAELAAVHAECDGDLDRMVDRLRVSKRGLRIRLQERG